MGAPHRYRVRERDGQLRLLALPADAIPPDETWYATEDEAWAAAGAELGARHARDLLTNLHRSN